MEIQYQVASLSDVDNAFSFSESRFSHEKSGPERMMAMWNAPWRREALEHYFKTGWSFVARENGQTIGYFMAQPFLHFRGQTQSVWVEHIEAVNSKVLFSLAEIAVKVAREKHIQRVLFPSTLADELAKLNGIVASEQFFEVKTTKG